MSQSPIFLFSPVVPVKTALELLALAKVASENLLDHALEAAKDAKNRFVQEYTESNVFSDNDDNALVAWESQKDTIFDDRTGEFKDRVHRMSTNIDHVGKFNMSTSFTISPEMVLELLDTIPNDLRDAGLDYAAISYNSSIMALLYS